MKINPKTIFIKVLSGVNFLQTREAHTQLNAMAAVRVQALQNELKAVQRFLSQDKSTRLYAQHLLDEGSDVDLCLLAEVSVRHLVPIVFHVLVCLSVFLSRAIAYQPQFASAVLLFVAPLMPLSCPRVASLFSLDAEFI